MNEQHGFAPSPSSTFGQGISNTASDPSVREVLGVYPFMQYTPSARGKCAFPSMPLPTLTSCALYSRQTSLLLDPHSAGYPYT